MIDCDKANYARDENNNDYCVGNGETVAVRSYSSGASPYGVLNMSGNVWEWVSDWYQPDYYQSQDAVNPNPQGPPSGDKKVLRGGSWGNWGYFTRTAYRNKSANIKDNIGFRCSQDGNE